MSDKAFQASGGRSRRIMALYRGQQPRCRRPNGRRRPGRQPDARPLSGHEPKPRRASAGPSLFRRLPLRCFLPAHRGHHRSAPDSTRGTRHRQHHRIRVTSRGHIRFPVFLRERGGWKPDASRCFTGGLKNRLANARRHVEIVAVQFQKYGGDRLDHAMILSSD
jgi:hypothetical protein